MNKNILAACDKLMHYLHTLNVHYVHVHNVRYTSLRSNNNTKLSTTPVHNRRAICSKNIKPAQRLAENQHNRLNTSERILSLELWSLTQGYLDLTFNYVALPARWCTTQSKKAIDAFPWGIAASSNILLTSNCLIIYKYIFYMITWIITKLSTLSKLPVLAVAYPVFLRESLNL